LPIRWHYFVWTLLLIRLAIPWLPESRVSIFNLIPRSVQQGRIIESFSEPKSTRAMDFYLYTESANTQEPENKSEGISVRFARMLPMLWLVGTVLIAGYVCMRNVSMWRTVKLDLLEDCKMQMRVETILGVVVSDRIKSPALFGFVRPRLLLPQGMLETYGLEELRYVFIHELAHLRQRDIYLGWLMALLQVVHWFNPLMWFAFSRIRTDREIACDRLAISTMEADEPPRYGRTIVSLLESFSQTRYLPSVAGILEDTCQIERRIKMIADYKKTSHTRWAGAMLLLAVLACVVLTNAYVAKADFAFGTATNLGPTVNSIFNEGFPSTSADGLELYFGSDRSGGSGKYDLWVTTRDTKDDEWGPPMNLGPTVNTSGTDKCPSISADGLSLFFASKRAGGAMDLWVTTRDTKDDPWGPPTPTINSSFAEGCPSISSDGLSLFFRADLPGGFGRRDLWVTTRAMSDDDWGPPVNLGPTVNSASADHSPSISADGLMLFFHSDRPGGYGDMDLYVTMRATTSDPWSTPVNLGPTINSSSRDDSPSISDDGSTLFFTSNRPGGSGDSDLWQVQIEPIVDLDSYGIVIYVDDAAVGANDGTNWDNAYVCLQDALAASRYGDEIRAAKGIYKADQHFGGGRFTRIVASGYRIATFQLKNGVMIKGGYAGLGQPDPDARDIEVYETILSGDLDGNDRPYFRNNYENSYHVVTGNGTDETAVLDGFTITAGNANGNQPHHEGGGMLNNWGSPTVTNCTFRGNSGEHCGGMFNRNCTSLVTDCTFTGNSTQLDGGGMNNDSNGNPIVTNCTFTGNSAKDGGGMFNFPDSSPTLTNCVFNENSANDRGGGIYNWVNSNPTIVNCIFSGNSATEGGAIYIVTNSSSTITNCILWGNTATSGPQLALYENSSVAIDYCDLQGGLTRIDVDPSSFVTWGPGNTDADPLFVDAANADYHLQAGSPCIDAGDNSAIPQSVVEDIDGNPRIINGIVDMGAYEYGSQLKAINPIPADGATDVTRSPTLGWTAGDGAVLHDVYFGTDEEAVRNATLRSPEYKVTKDLGSESYEPGQLQWDTTYYWRIDEYNANETTSESRVWRFTVVFMPDPLAEALDTDLRFTTGGSADWLSQTVTSYHDGDAAKSGDISHDQESWLQTTVSGAGKVSFFWKVSCEGHFDFLAFYIDGSLAEKIDGLEDDWEQQVHTISTSGSHTLEWRYAKDGSRSEGSDCGWVDKVVWTFAP
ncbi:MAG: M56 family metallopeptidase, partial [Planctomycetota bacterium]